MAIEYRFDSKDNLLVCTSWGFDESLQDTLSYGVAVMQACLQAESTHILCDERALVYRLDILDTYELAKYYAKHVPQVVKAAIVCSPDQIKDAGFWETVAVNRGMTVRVFKELADAEAWLNN